MAFPYIFSASFDTGDNSEWDSEADTGTKLDFPHYTTLVNLTGRPTPYRGAYCMRIASIADTNDHTLTEADLDIGDGNTAWVRFALYVSTDFAATANDAFNIFEWQQAGGTVEASMGLNIVATTDAVTIGVGDGTAPAAYPGTIVKGQWNVIEAAMLVSTGGAGTLTLYINGNSVQALTGLTNAAAVGAGVLGTQDTAATTSAGYLLFDEFAFDDTRIGIPHRWSTHRIITTSSFLFVGSGRLGNVKLLDGGGGDVKLDLYDTDVYNSSLTPIWYGQTATANVDVDAADVPIDFRRGCLAVLSGTTPGAQFMIQRATGWGSDGAIRTHAAKRLPHPGGL